MMTKKTVNYYCILLGPKMSFYEVIEIHEGYSNTSDKGMVAICTCTLIKGKYNCIVNTMIPSNGELILKVLKDHQLKPEDIHYVICTNGDSGLIGNNHLFLESTHIIGHTISMKDIYHSNSLIYDRPYELDGKRLQLLPTPGLTLVDITVLVKTSRNTVVAITGGLFEKKEDLTNNYIWLFSRPECPSLQRYYRNYIMNTANRIIPGHGAGFEVDDDVKASFDNHNSTHENEKLLSLRDLYRLGLS
ncbi:unnamed protein product [Nezara viridula]|uniref:Metallo-beta-lactamase domain-containing protein n=1 Tax=Nezara viridula TaxID=85310 RepID=A0A9P0HQ70_NEZVI|nr:unnamed protein product [Nezara viridula]